MNRREVLGLGLVGGAALALPPLLRRRIVYEPIPSAPGFRRVAMDVPGGGVFAGLNGAPDLGEVDLCADLFQGAEAAFFSDPLCPNCPPMSQRVKDLGLTVTWHDWPVFGPRAEALAKLSVALRALGGDPTVLYGMPILPQGEALERFAEAQALPIAPLRDAMGRAEPSLDRARALASRLGLIGTPSLVVGNTVVEGLQPRRRLKRIAAQAGPPPCPSPPA